MTMTQDIIQIPAGTLQMDTTTVHLEAFYMDIHPVTNAQFKAFIEAKPQWQRDNIADKCHDGNYLKSWTGTDFPDRKAYHPVVYVSWYAAIAYTHWVGGRLPTETEWLWAARGGLTDAKYPWGNEHPSVHAENWHAARLTAHHHRQQKIEDDYQEQPIEPKPMPPYIQDMVRAAGDDPRSHAVANYWNLFSSDTTPIGCFPANNYGLFDMTGNVWEWCDTPCDTPEGEHRVVRGGSFRTEFTHLSLATTKTAPPPQLTTIDLGFRCAFDLEAPVISDK